MKSFLCNPKRSEGTLLPKGFLGVPLDSKKIGNSKPFFRKFRAQNFRRAFFARWGGQRETFIAKKVLEVLL
jgi:hypothetical protein